MKKSFAKVASVIRLSVVVGETFLLTPTAMRSSDEGGLISFFAKIDPKMSL